MIIHYVLHSHPENAECYTDLLHPMFFPDEQSALAFLKEEQEIWGEDWDTDERTIHGPFTFDTSTFDL